VTTHWLCVVFSNRTVIPEPLTGATVCLARRLQRQVLLAELETVVEQSEGRPCGSRAAGPRRVSGAQRTVSVSVGEEAALRLSEAGTCTRYLFTALTVGLIVNLYVPDLVTLVEPQVCQAPE
jgi:hypothetical protein